VRAGAGAAGRSGGALRGTGAGAGERGCFVFPARA
jgi:hypothetical protein